MMPFDLAFARALHVLAIVHWIGGVSFVTLVVLPAARRLGAQQGIELFAAMERRFSAQVRVSIPLAGASGFWMTWRMELWERFILAPYWWMGAMLALWLVFMTAVFVVEPLAHRRFEAAGRRDPRATLIRMLAVHLVLLCLAAITILGAVAGSYGFLL